jgi:hypothetical protein
MLGGGASGQEGEKRESEECGCPAADHGQMEGMAA